MSQEAAGLPAGCRLSLGASEASAAARGLGPHDLRMLTLPRTTRRRVTLSLEPIYPSAPTDTGPLNPGKTCFVFVRPRWPPATSAKTVRKSVVTARSRPS